MLKLHTIKEGESPKKEKPPMEEEWHDSDERPHEIATSTQPKAMEYPQL